MIATPPPPPPSNVGPHSTWEDSCMVYLLLIVVGMGTLVTVAEISGDFYRSLVQPRPVSVEPETPYEPETLPPE